MAVAIAPILDVTVKGNWTLKLLQTSCLRRIYHVDVLVDISIARDRSHRLAHSEVAPINRAKLLIAELLGYAKCYMLQFPTAWR